LIITLQNIYVQVQYHSGLIARPKQLKTDFLMHKVTDRAELEPYRTLVVGTSAYCHVCEHGRAYRIGQGLFAGIDYEAGARIVNYRGRLISRADYERSTNKEYGVGMGRFVLDCSESVVAGLCKASRSNDPTNLRLIENRRIKANANMNISINRMTKKAYLIATKRIARGEEMFVSYGEDYHVVLQERNLI